MITLDINQTHNLALVTDDDMDNARYEPITGAHQVDEGAVEMVYLRQYHALANTVAVGLTVRSLGYPKEGWKRLNSGSPA